MEDYIEEGDLVILGNRYESQLCAIEMRAGCIIVCEGAKVSMTIKKLAQEHHCVVISTPHDTFTAARLINQSMPIRYFMKSDNLTIFNVNEKTDDIKEIMGQKRYRDFPIVDKDDNYIGMISRRNLLNLKRKQVIMVDHNEESQAVDGIDHAEDSGDHRPPSSGHAGDHVSGIFPEPAAGLHCDDHVSDVPGAGRGDSEEDRGPLMLGYHFRYIDVPFSHLYGH